MYDHMANPPLDADTHPAIVQVTIAMLIPSMVIGKLALNPDPAPAVAVERQADEALWRWSR